MTARALTLLLAAALPSALLAAGATARADDACANAAAYLDTARTESRAGRWGPAGAAARSAASRFDTCAHQQEGSDYAGTLLNDAGARVILGLALIKSGARRDNAQIRLGYSLYSYVAQYVGATQLQRQLAAKKATAMLRVDPSLRLTLSYVDVPPSRLHMDGGSTARSVTVAAVEPAGPPPRTAPPEPTAPAITTEIVASWATHAVNAQTNVPISMQHVRVRVTASREVVVRSSEFQITVRSESEGQTVVHGMDAPAPPILRTNFMPVNGLANSVDPNEDLGVSPLRIYRDATIFFVVSFLVPADAQFDPNAPQAIRWVPAR